MFDIEDSSDVELDGNKTNREELAKVKGVDGFKAKNNEANVEPELLIQAKEDMIELKPNFMGLGLNLNAIWRKIFSK